jgi:MFS transporter, AAHS family, 4-hydroxybenzoate transporter
MTSGSVNVTELIDTGPISTFQIRIFMLCALIYFLAGIDFQVIGVAAPLIAKEYAIARASLGWVFSAGTLGSAFGALSCGLIADRFGPRKILLITVLVFGFATLAVAAIDGFVWLAVSRFLTGLGLGGAVPCFVALTSEYAPRRLRATIVTLVLSSFPLGAMTGATVSAYIILHGVWRDLFYIFGVAPLIAACISFIWLPESVRFSLVRHNDTRKVNRIVSRVLGRPVPADAPLKVVGQRAVSMPLKHLFVEGRIRCTLPLWIAAFIVTGAMTVMSTWTSTLILPLGFSPAEAAIVVALNGFGMFLGHCGTGRLIERCGVGRIVVPAFALTTVAVAVFPLAGKDGMAVLGTTGFVAGLFLGFCHSSVLVLSALIYPVAVRSTGVGFAMSMCWFGSAFTPVLVGFTVALGLSVGQIYMMISLPILLSVACMWAIAVYGRRDKADGSMGASGQTISPPVQ